jgi:hypothetical protein
MRHLSVKQKKVIDQFLKTNPGVITYDDLPESIQEELDKLNMYECLWSDVTRYMSDNYARHGEANKQ